jgi:hypothetical protein
MQFVSVPADEGLFFGAGPAFELGFTTLSIIDRVESLTICQFQGQVDPGRPASVAGEVVLKSPFKISRRPDIKTARRT